MTVAAFLNVMGVALLVAFFIWALVILARGEQNGKVRAFKSIGQRFGYEWQDSKDRLVRREGNRVLHLIEEPSSRFTSTRSVLEVRLLETNDFCFNLTPENTVTKAAGFAGLREIQTGDRHFDELWFVQTNDPEFLGAILTDEVRRLLVAETVTGLHGVFQAGPGFVRYSIQGALSHAEVVPRLESQCELLMTLADSLEVYDAD